MALHVRALQRGEDVALALLLTCPVGLTVGVPRSPSDGRAPAVTCPARAHFQPSTNPAFRPSSSATAQPGAVSAPGCVPRRPWR